MKFSVLFYDALNALKRNKKRSILTMLGIIIGIGAVITIISIGNGFQNYVMENLTDEGDESVSIAISFVPKNQNMYEDPNVVFFSTQDISEIKSIDGVKDVKFSNEGNESASQNLEVVTRNGKVSSMVETVKSTNKEIIEGRNLNSLDNDLKQRVAVLSEEKADEILKDYNEKLGSSITINGLGYKVVGIYKKEEFTMGINVGFSDISIPKKTYESFEPEEKNSPGIQVFLESGVSVKDTAKKVVDKLKTTGSMKDLGTYNYFDISEMLEGISKVLNQITIFIALIGGISLFIAGIGMMNMMFISVSERTKEIGIRRAIGATKGNITMQFLLEGVVVTVIGGIFGYLFGLLMAMVISAFLPFKAAVDVGPIVVALLISLVIGIVFSYAPAKSAANKNVIEILS
ncbi:ABC transporter permease [Lagierella massiliensis]|uniref:ABC transporter permease n=1 Tax=Lagierella massiliensis TaxID=1689303 RepID=UPI0006D850C6|nr:ABC transporter permease [Lagierella massiliensis]